MMRVQRKDLSSVAHTVAGELLLLCV